MQLAKNLEHYKVQETHKRITILYNICYWPGPFGNDSFRFKVTGEERKQ